VPFGHVLTYTPSIHSHPALIQKKIPSRDGIRLFETALYKRDYILSCTSFWLTMMGTLISIGLTLYSR
jgi:hypothetical protein